MKMIFFALWGLSLLLMLAAAAQLWRAFVRKKEEVTRALAKSLGLLFVSIFCVRLAVGLYLADGALVKEPNGLNLFETALDSAVHSLQTFSMDESYTDYLFAGRDLWQWMSGSAAAVTLAGMYISLQNLLAPISGGAILLDLLSNLFPWLRYHLQGGRRKYVFSELNESAVLLAEDLVRAEQGVRLVGEAAAKGRMAVIFTDAYVDKENEQRAELLARARKLGGICLEDDLQQLRLPGRGRVTYLLMDQDPMANLDAAIALQTDCRALCPKADEIDILVFSQDENAGEILKQAQARLGAGAPVTKVVREDVALAYRLLTQQPLYLPLLNHPAQTLKLLVLGDTLFCREFIRAAYWCGQMSGPEGKPVRLELHLAAQDPETLKNELAMAMPGVQLDAEDPYAAFAFYSIRADGRDLEQLFQETPALNGCAYAVVDLGADGCSLDAARWLQRRLDLNALTNPTRTFVNYLIRDPHLCWVLNEKQRTEWCSCRAFGSEKEQFSVENVFAPVLEQRAFDVNAHHNPDDWKKFQQDEYKRRSSMAVVVHAGYKLFSATPKLLNPENGQPCCEGTQARAAVQKNKALLAWQEHRRWSAYTLSIGYRCPTAQELAHYMLADPDKRDAKQEHLRLHPCLVDSRPGEGAIRPEDWAAAEREDFDDLDNFSLKFHHLLRCKLPDAWAELEARRAEADNVIGQWLYGPEAGTWAGCVRDMYGCRAELEQLGLSRDAAMLAVPTDFKQWDYEMLSVIPEYLGMRPQKES